MVLMVYRQKSKGHYSNGYKMMYLTDLRKERKHWKERGNMAEVKAIDAELVRRAQDRVSHKKLS